MSSDIVFSRSISYAGGDAPDDLVGVTFELPVLQYAEDGPEQIVRHVTGGVRTAGFSQPANHQAYRLTVDDGFLTGLDPALAWRYALDAADREDVPGLTVPVSVLYRAADAQPLGEQQLHVVTVPVQTWDPDDPRRRMTRNDYIVVDGKRLAELGQSPPLTPDAPWVGALTRLVVLDDQGRPEVSDNAIDGVSRWLSDRFGADVRDAIIERLTRNFRRLVDIALTIPDIARVEIGGEVEVLAPEGTVVTGRDLGTFEIVAEWTDAQDGVPNRLGYRFSPDVSVVDATAPFSLTRGSTIYRNTVAGRVGVRVRGVDGATLWERSFASDDATLRQLVIQVALQARTELTVPGSTPTDANLRLRGRVIVLNQRCPTRDVMVLLQAKVTAEDPWRVVGAATADSAGNFGMPFPYGTFVAAQAVVSLAPADPIDVRVVPAAPGAEDRTISPDFLYLLVRHPYGSERPCGKDDCECGSADKPDRLPEFADLIGSEVYSQDIGGSCVNLSKPNRTISEFPFSAIVRTSDPEVGTYRLTRREDGLSSVDVSQVAALRAVTASLARTSTTALELARQNAAGSPNAGTRLVLEAMEAAHPHALSLESAFAAGGPPITLTQLGIAETQVDVVVATLEAARDQASREDLSFPYQVYAVIDAATALQPLVRVAIDTVGPSIRYDLAGDPATRTRGPISLANPVEWQPGAVAMPASNVLSAVRLARMSRAPTADDTPAVTFAQAVSVATGHLLHYKALFKADGYSLGDLVYSLPLAPGQKKEIVVFDAAQTLLGAESQVLTQNERLAMGLVDERAITSALVGGIAENLSGSSQARTSGVSAGFGTAGQGSGGTGAYGGSGGAVLGIAGGTAEASSNARQQGSRDVAQFFGEKLRQAIMQNAEGYRELNASVVTTVQQGQRYGVTSEVIANHNHCHSLTMMYFEVLRHYAIFQELSSVEECVFVPFLLARLTTENLGVWRDVLAPALLPLPSETYLQPFVEQAGPGRRHPLVKGFDAIQRLRTNYANVDLPAGSYDAEPIRFMNGALDLRVSLPRPRTRYDRIKSVPVVRRRVSSDEVDVAGTMKRSWFDAVAVGLTGGLSLLVSGPPGTNIEYREVDVLAKQAVFDAFMSMDANFENVPPAQCMRVTNFNPTSITVLGQTFPIAGLDFFEDGLVDRTQWEHYATLLGYPNLLSMLNYYFRGQLIAEWDDIFYTDIAPLIFDKVVTGLRLTEFATDFTAQSRYTGGDRVVRITVSGTTTKARNALPTSLALTVNDSSVRALRNHVVLNVQGMRLEYSTPHFNGLLYSGTPGDDLLDGVSLDIPESPAEKRNPRREDRYLAAALIDHLNGNLEYYNKVLWSRLDPDRRYMLLDGFSIQTYADDGTPIPAPAGLRSLASVVKNDVIAVAGNSLVFPVAPGYRVSGSFIAPPNQPPDEGVGTPTLLDHYEPLTPVPPYRISVPTKGVFAEAVQGVCNACEKVETDRLQDWSRFPIDEPTDISPVTLPAPGPQDWRAAFRDFAPPIVNVQSGPAAPAPGAGLAGLSELLGNSQVFRDITGLDANQQNAIRTYLSNQENAKAFGEMAKELAMQNNNSRNSRTIMDGIAQARSSDTISQETAGQLVKDHLQQQIDGGAGKRTKAEADQQAAATPLSRAAVDAADRGQDVTATRQDGAGNSEAVTIRGGGSGRVVEVRGTVPALRQEKTRDCWAVAAAMLTSWKKAASVTPERAATAAGQRYRKMYLDDTGLPAESKDDFLLRSHMAAEPPASYRLEQYEDWLRTFGPLWVTVDSAPGQLFSPHARVLIRIARTGAGGEADFTFIDPANASELTQSFNKFVQSYEQMVTDNRSARLFPQVVHFLERVDQTEGFQIEGPFDVNEPIHESISLAALIDSGAPVPPGTGPGDDPATNEFLRGVIWNDDPAVLMFDEDEDDNWNFSSGISWFVAFTFAKHAAVNNVTNLTGRSHFFDLQFLHGMAEQAGEQPGDTLSKIMLWAEVMYRLSVGEGVAGTDKLGAIAIASDVTFGGAQYSATLSTYFDDYTVPTGQDTLTHLLTQDTAFTGLDLGRRAIGSLMHVVQDSYARGHVRRTLDNPQDLVPGTTETFKPGTYGRWGGVENFHSYRGQDPKAHDRYDRPAEKPRPTDLNSFNSLLGGRSAVDASSRLLAMWRTQTPWAAAGGAKEYLEGTVFKLSPNATPADATV